jgi:uncharacterized membrane protein
MIPTSHLHPMLVHFPIALITFGFLAVLITVFFRKKHYLPKTGYYLLLAGTVMALVALLSGILFTSDLSGSAAAVQDQHETFAWITLLLSIGTSIFWSILKYRNQESTNMKWVVVVMYGLAAISVSITGFLGGTLVYNYMMPI